MVVLIAVLSGALLLVSVLIADRNAPARVTVFLMVARSGVLKLLPCVLIAALSELARVTVFLMVTLRAFAGVFIVFTAILATAERAVRLRIVKRTGALFVFRVLTSALSVVDKERNRSVGQLSISTERPLPVRREAGVGRGVQHLAFNLN